MVACVTTLTGAHAGERSAFLERHCLDCHDAESAKGGLNLESLPFELSEAASFDKWVRIHDLVHAGEMPPKKKRRPNLASRQTFLAALANELTEVDRRRIAKEGRGMVRRLNRFEYENSLRELLHAPWLLVADRLPEDGTVHLFNKSGGSLDVSHVQMEKYLEVGRHALRAAMNAAAHPPKTTRFHAREEPMFQKYMKWRPGLQTAATRSIVPLLDLRPMTNVIRGLEPITVGATDPETRERESMGVFSGTYAATTKYDFTRMEIPIDGRYRVRMKTFTFLAGTNGASGGRDHGLTGGHRLWWRPDRNVAKRSTRSEPVTLYALRQSGDTRWLTTFDAHPDAGVVECEVSLNAGEMIRPDASRLVRTRPGWKGNPNATTNGIPGVAFHWLELEGPVTGQWPPESYRALFGELPFTARDGEVTVSPESPDQDARRLIRSFAVRAFRGHPLPDGALDRYARIYDAARGFGDDFTGATLAAFNAVLCSPEFLFQEIPTGRLDGPSLANRLSHFLWNGPPDDELLRTVTDLDTLRPSTERLLQDARSARFVNAFLDYWLDLRQLSDTAPDAELYPDYYLDTLLSESALLETRRYFTALIEENLPARNLVDSDFTYVNERLARHYGLLPEAKEKNRQGDNQDPAAISPRLTFSPSHFLETPSVSLRKTALPPASPYGGLLTQASVLKVTANGTTTSPVLRGVWLVERLLGIEVPPPPSGVEAIEPDTRGAVTIREQLAKHSAVSSCAACHRKFDPVGFALENFDVMGGWRDRYRAVGEIGDPVTGLGKNGHAFTFRLARPVESQGQLSDGESFTDIHGLKRLLLKDERAIARNLLNHLIVFATGAPVSFADRTDVEEMLDACRPDYRVRDLIHALVQNRIFLNK